jgi:glycosidase
MTPNWIQNAFFYHIYPLGLLGAPHGNDFTQPVTHRIDGMEPWLDHIQSLGANAIYLGPVFQSSSHGYDTVDYMQVDRRLGENQDLVSFSDKVHARGMHLVLDAVFNHVGRDFWAFKDLLANGENSLYRDWFQNIRFGVASPHGDPFNYEGWHGHTSLVKLNLSHPAVREHLFSAVQRWAAEFRIDGLRLDAADCIDLGFLRDLRQFTDGLSEEFWLMGEVVHGDYRKWVNPETLHSVTNYECYKGLYSSLQEGNYFEIDYALNRQFGNEGIYRELHLYNFVDNHDVDRVASKLGSSALLYPLYLLLFTMPGVPSVYYGSEWGLQGEKGQWSDAALRPTLALNQIVKEPPERDLAKVIAELAGLRDKYKALRTGIYQSLMVDHRQMAFLREYQDERLVVLLNSASEGVEFEMDFPWGEGSYIDLLDPGFQNRVDGGKMVVSIPPQWGRILKQE